MRALPLIYAATSSKKVRHIDLGTARLNFQIVIAREIRSVMQAAKKLLPDPLSFQALQWIDI